MILRPRFKIFFIKIRDGRIGHKYFSAEKSCDPVLRRRAPTFDSRKINFVNFAG